MLIGDSYNKIQFDAFGLNLLEPNTFIGDTILAIAAFYLAIKVSRLKGEGVFFSSWKYFFIVFGVGFFLGGLGHLFYNYWGIPGKNPSWYLGILATFFIERAMISIHGSKKTKQALTIVSQLKLILALVAALCVSLFVNLEEDYSRGMIVPTINSSIGLIYSLGYLGYQYSQESPSFKYLWISVLLLLPSVFFQAFNINPAQWFDKNDVGHFLLLISLFLYFASVQGYSAKLSDNS